MDFNLTSFLLGSVLGAAVAFMLRVQALKSLSLKLDQLGVGLGIEGFEDKQTSSSLTIGDVEGGIRGDLAGRDINKGTSNFYNNLRKALSANPRRRLRLIRSEHLQIRSNDHQFIEELRQIERKGDGWFGRYVDLCMENPEIQSAIHRKIQEIQNTAWEPVSLQFDNISEGIRVNIEIEQDYSK
jgi:hypothetical protein